MGFLKPIEPKFYANGFIIEHNKINDLDRRNCVTIIQPTIAQGIVYYQLHPDKGTF